MMVSDTMKRIPRDVAIIVAGGLTLPILNWVTVPVPLAMLLVLPIAIFGIGYLLLSALTGSGLHGGVGEAGPTPANWIAGSVGLSLAALGVTMSVLHLTVGADRSTVLGVIAGMTLLLGIGAATRRTIPTWTAPASSAPSPTWWRPVVTVLAIAILLVASGTVYIVSTTDKAESFTELFFSVDGSSSDLFRLDAGRAAAVELVVVNHEGREATYRITASLLSESNVSRSVDAPQIPPLADGERWKGTLTLGPLERGTYKLTVDLVIGDQIEPYRSLHLWVRATGGTNA